MYKKLIKSFLDKVFAVILIILLAIPMLIIAIIIKFDSMGPVLFRQERIGENGKIFKIFKFRTMINDADKKGDLFTSNNDWRITKIGKFLRSTSIDEIPQFFNVLSGNMSFIGPRPDVPEAMGDDEYQKLLKKMAVKPGITGYAQVKGRSSITLDKRTEYDEYYAENVSFILDIKILFMTVKVILGKTGVN